MELTTTPQNSLETGHDIASARVNPLRWGDYFLLGAFCAVLFGYVAVSGRPLTLHEARLPELSREMMATHNWLVPMDGDRPWLERPPLPHWCMIAVAKVIGQRCDTRWSVGVPPALAGLFIVLMTARIAAGWFGRGIGVVSGLVLATMYEFYTYSTLAEDDIFLGVLVMGAMALFVGQEFHADPMVEEGRIGFLGWRPWRVAAFFVFLGLTNLAKGPVVGAAVVIGAIAAYFVMPSILWEGGGDLSFVFHFPPEQRRRICRYWWVWGILGAGVIALSWHVYVARLYPGVGGYLANLRYDFSETHEFDEPWWYYPVMLLGRAMPWIPAAIVALVVTARQAWGDPKQLLLDHGNDQTPTHRAETTGRGQGGFPRSTRGGGNSALRFLWCWAIVPIIVLSIPHRKHHHYLVPSLPPWAILAALGLKPIAELMFKGPASTRRARFGLMVVGVPLGIAIVILGWKRLLSPSGAIVSQVESGVFLAALAGGCIWLFYHGLWTKNGKWMLAAIVIGMSGVFSWEQTQLRDDYVPDTFFLRQDVAAVVPGDKLLVINAAIGPLNFFRVQFYLRGDAVLVHNLTYLRSDRIHASEAYVVGQVGDLQFLRTLGDAKMMSRSARPEKKDTPALALFHLVFSADLKRYPAPAVSVMQAMMRESGPWCGPEGGGG